MQECDKKMRVNQEPRGTSDENCEELLSLFQISASSLDLEMLEKSLKKMLTSQEPLIHDDLDSTHKALMFHLDRRQEMASILLQTFPLLILLHIHRKDIIELWLEVLFSRCGYWVCISTLVDNDYYFSETDTNRIESSLYVLKQLLFPEKKNYPPKIEVVLLDYIAHEASMGEVGETHEEAVRGANQLPVSQECAVEAFANFLVMLPIQVSSACYQHNNRLGKKKENHVLFPHWMKPSIYPKAIVEITLTATLATIKSSNSTSLKTKMKYLFEEIFWRVNFHGGTKDTVLGTHAVWLRRHVEQMNQTSFTHDTQTEMEGKRETTGYYEKNVDTEFRDIILDIMPILSTSQSKNFCDTTPPHRQQMGKLKARIHQNHHYLCKWIQAIFVHASKNYHYDHATAFLTCVVLPILQSVPSSIREEIVTFTIIQRPWFLKSSSSSNNKYILTYCKLVPKLMVRFLAKCSEESEDSKTNNSLSSNRNPSVCVPLRVLFRFLKEVCSVWSELSFINHSNILHQQLLTNFILESFQIIDTSQASTWQAKNDHDQNSNIIEKCILMQHHDTVAVIVSGISLRLESTFDIVRKDGMKVAEALAPLIGQQKVHFDELDGEREQSSVFISCQEEIMIQNGTASGKAEGNSKGRACQLNVKNKERPHETDLLEMDPEEEYNTDDDIDNNSSTEDYDQVNPNSLQQSEQQEQQQYNYDETLGSQDESSVSLYDDEFAAYNLSDDEEDLKPVKRPMYLRDCLELLRASDDDTDAYAKHEEGMKQVASIIRSRPYDLPDLSMQLAGEMLHAENKYDIPNFMDFRLDGLTALAVCEPRSIALDYLICKSLFSDSSVSSGTRLLILNILMCAAEELCGNRSYDQLQRLPGAYVSDASCIDSKKRYETSIMYFIYPHFVVRLKSTNNSAFPFAI